MLVCFPRLRVHVAARRFIPMPETEIEEGHGKMKKKVAYRACQGLTQSMALRSPELLWYLEVEDFKLRMKRWIEVARRPQTLAQALNLVEHPSVLPTYAKVIRGESHAKMMIAIVIKVFYRNDPKTKFRNHSEARKYNKSTTDRMKRTDLKMLENEAINYSNVLGRAWLDHFRKVADNGDVLQLGEDTAKGLRLDRLQDYFTNPRIKQEAPPPEDPSVSASAAEASVESTADDTSFELDVMNTSTGAAAGQANADPRLLLKITHVHPGRQHLVYKRAMEGRNLSAREVCVSAMRNLGDWNLEESATPTPCACNQSSTMESTIISNLHKLVDKASRKEEESGTTEMTIWKRGRTMYCVEGAEANTKALHAITALVRNCAWSLESSMMVAPSDDVMATGLLHLQELGYVAESPNAHWRILEHAKKHITFGNELQDPLPALQTRFTISDSVERHTVFELMLHFRSLGWEWRKKPSTKK